MTYDVSKEAASFQILPAEEKHVEQMIDCHLAAFPGEFTSQLGRGYLRRSHRLYIHRPEGIAQVSVETASGRVAGFVKGGDPAIKSIVARRVFWCIVPIALWRTLTCRRFRQRMTYHLGRIGRKFMVKLHLVGKPSQPAEPPADPVGTWSNLVSICAHPDFRGKGVGLSLMEAFRRESDRRGYRTMRLSVHNDNESAKAMYVKAGWTPILTVPSGTYFKRNIRENE